jgi:hypothetical protein
MQRHPIDVGGSLYKRDQRLCRFGALEFGRDLLFLGQPAVEGLEETLW